MSREKKDYNKYHDSDFETALDLYEKQVQKDRELSYLDWSKKYK